MNQTRSNDDVCQYLTFFVAGEQYALDVLRVREVVGLAPITRVPSAPPDVRGVVNLRGSVIPVVDLGLRFHRRELSLTVRTCIVVVERGGSDEPCVGLLVDSVDQVVALGARDIEPLPAFGASGARDLLAGLAPIGASFVQILLPDRVAVLRDRLGEPS